VSLYINQAYKQCDNEDCEPFKQQLSQKTQFSHL